jgi:hypothetical protein
MRLQANVASSGLSHLLTRMERVCTYVLCPRVMPWCCCCSGLSNASARAACPHTRRAGAADAGDWYNLAIEGDCGWAVPDKWIHFDADTDGPFLSDGSKEEAHVQATVAQAQRLRGQLHVET